MKRFLLGFGLALAARFPFGVPLMLKGEFNPTTPDAAGYFNLAKNLARGRGFSLSPEPPYEPDAFRTPGYPLLLAACFKLLGSDYRIAMLVNYALSGFTAGLLAAEFGLGAGVLWALNPLSLLWDQEPMTEPLFALLTIIALLAIRRRGLWASALAGAAWGLGALTRPVGLLVPLFGVWFFKSWREKALALASFGALVSPWALRNWTLWHEPFFSTVPWVNLSYYNAASLVGELEGVVHREAARRLFNEASRRFGWGLEAERELDIWVISKNPTAWRQVSEVALEKILAHPWLYLKLHLTGDLGALFPVNPRRVLWLYGIKRGERTGSAPELFKILFKKGPAAFFKRVASTLPWWALLFLAYAVIYQVYLYLSAALGFWRRRRERWALFAAASALYFALVPGPLAAPRHRYPADALLSSLANTSQPGRGTR